MHPCTLEDIDARNPSPDLPTCGLCGGAFPDRTSLTTHYRMKHQDLVNAYTLPQGDMSLGEFTRGLDELLGQEDG